MLWRLRTTTLSNTYGLRSEGVVSSSPVTCGDSELVRSETPVRPQAEPPQQKSKTRTKRKITVLRIIRILHTRIQDCPSF